MGVGGSGRVAVIGAGAAGLSAAYVLQRRFDVTLFERRERAGGHVHTVRVPSGPDAGTPVDTGFIVMNQRNYPLLTRLFEQLGVTLRDSDMSFGYWDQVSGIQYSGCGAGGVFAQRRNLLRPSFWRMVADILRFFRAGRRDLASGMPATVSLGQYLRRGCYSDAFIRHHLVPMGAAIWSTPCDQMLEFPALSFLRFFENHGLLSTGSRPQWRTVVGGSDTYVKRLLTGFRGEVRVASPVRSIRRRPDRVEVTCDGTAAERFDHAVVATHADEALALLSDPTPDEQRLLGVWRYQLNRAELHTDTSILPPLRGAWASWNYTRVRGSDPCGPATLTYDMTRLQGLTARERYLVTLNRAPSAPNPRGLVERIDYDHPTYSAAAMDTQSGLRGLNGVGRTYYCGSYFGYGFHEDAVRSGVEVARLFGLDL